MAVKIPAGQCAICRQPGAYAAMELPDDTPYAHRYCHRSCIEQYRSLVRQDAAYARGEGD